MQRKPSDNKKSGRYLRPWRFAIVFGEHAAGAVHESMDHTAKNRDNCLEIQENSAISAAIRVVDQLIEAEASEGDRLLAGRVG
jgi:hypothetical protein